MTRHIILVEYSFIGILLLFSFILSCIIFGASYIFIVSQPDNEKLSSYECGFDPYEDARNAFDVRFYLIAILFLLFDVETVLIFPWTASLGQLPPLGYWSVMDFVLELVLGFVYAWKVGALEWDHKSFEQTKIVPTL